MGSFSDKSDFREDANVMQQLNFGMLVRLVRRFWAWTIVCAIAGALIMGAVTHFFIPDEYTSTAKLHIQNGKPSSDYISSGNLAAAQALVDQTRVIFSSDYALEQAAALLDDGTTAAQLSAALSFSATTNNEAVLIRATAKDPATAYLYCSAIVAVAPDVMSSLYEVAKVKTLNEASLPVTPSAPDMLQNCLAGAIIGGLALIIVVVILEVTDMRIGHEADFKRRMEGLMILGEIPSFAEMEGDGE